MMTISNDQLSSTRYPEWKFDRRELYAAGRLYLSWLRDHGAR